MTRIEQLESENFIMMEALIRMECCVVLDEDDAYYMFCLTRDALADVYRQREIYAFEVVCDETLE